MGRGKGQFKNTGLNTTNKQPPVSVKLQPEIDAIVRSLPNRSEFLRDAVKEKLQRENLLPAS